MLIEIGVLGQPLRAGPVQAHLGQFRQIGLLAAVLGRLGGPLPVHGGPVLIVQGAAVVLRPVFHGGVEDRVLQGLVLGVVLQRLSLHRVVPLDGAVLIGGGDVITGVGQPVQDLPGGDVPPVDRQHRGVGGNAGGLGQKRFLMGLAAAAAGQNQTGGKGQARDKMSFHRDSPLLFLRFVEKSRTEWVGDVPRSPFYAGN